MRITTDAATYKHDISLNPFTGEEVYTTRNLRDRKLQRARIERAGRAAEGRHVHTIDTNTPPEANAAVPTNKASRPAGGRPAARRRGNAGAIETKRTLALCGSLLSNARLSSCDNARPRARAQDLPY